LEIFPCPLACDVYRCSDCFCQDLGGYWHHECPSCNFTASETEECIEYRKCSDLDWDTCTDEEITYCNWIFDQEAHDASGWCTDIGSTDIGSSSDGPPWGVIIPCALVGFCLCVVLLVAALYLKRRMEKDYGVKNKPRSPTACVDRRYTSERQRQLLGTHTVFVNQSQGKARAVTVYCENTQEGYEEEDEEEGNSNKIEDTRTKEEETPSLKKLINHDATPIEKILECDFNNTPTIGEGSFGYVVKAIYANMEVALKRFKIPWTEWSAKEKKDFKIEIGEGLKLRHENIVRYYGWTEDPVSVIMELCPHGSLKDYFKAASHRGKNISNMMLLNWAIGAAKGITYLHSKSLVHRDIAARNLLLDKHLEIRVSDFGMARIVSSSDKDLGKTETMVGPLKWMPPESLRDQEYSKKTDTYAFGITLWEIFSLGEEPYSGKSAVQAALFSLTSEKNRPNLDSISFKHVIRNMKRCWKYLPDDRPHMKDVVEGLSKLRVYAESALPNLDSNDHSAGFSNRPELGSNYNQSAGFSGRPEFGSNYGQSAGYSGRSEMSTNYNQSPRVIQGSDVGSNYNQSPRVIKGSD